MEGAGDSAEASAALQKCVRENCQHFACPYSQNRKLARMYERPVDLEFKRDDGAYYLREPQQRAYEFVLKQVQDSKDDTKLPNDHESWSFLIRPLFSCFDEDDDEECQISFEAQNEKMILAS